MKPVSKAKDEDGDIQMTEFAPRPRRILLHCADGYTETSMLAVAYFMYAEGVPLHDAWVRLHREKQRNFFAYPSDVALLNVIQDRILRESPKFAFTGPSSVEAPSWIARLDGSLPSRILPYMYLGNLTHANNPEMLKLLGIGRILSVGEPVAWTEDQVKDWGRENLLMVDRVQDNGIDELTVEMQRCLEFIGESQFPEVRKRNNGMANERYRTRQSRRYSNTRPLPRRRLSISDNLHSGGHGLARSEFPSRIVSLLHAHPVILHLLVALPLIQPSRC